ncbi:peptidase M16 [Alistipes sp. An54]|uniref:M16 family metallopeptidase n=1 Tax=Alistipes sp. An54 TaxID=1965645 RepID=UPI000B36EF81|nr:pitrilysin family protein [Alistipes sp. An54]OUN75490.1 peptidase M16 [Alistipes sp. An54]
MRPPRITPSEVDVQLAEKHTLANGVALYTLASEDFEVLRFSFVFRAGSAVQTVPFSASAAANLLAEGSTEHSAQQIAEQLDYYGSWYDVNIDRDYAYISFATLSKFFDHTLAVAEEILLRPAFPEAELRTYAAKRRQRLAIDRTKVDVEAREAFARALFGPRHPYGISSSEELYDSLTRRDVVEFYRRFYTAERCFVVCSGRIGDHELQALGNLAGRLPRRGVVEDPRFPAPETVHEAFVDHPGAVQSSLRLGRLLFPRQHPDFVGMQVVATALGGYFGSRLMQNLRERNGYTYGVVAAMVNFERAGYFAVATQVGTDVTRQALGEIYREIELLRTDPMPEEELALVKNMMTGEMMRILDGPFGIADVTIENILCGTDNYIIGENIRRIRSMTPDDVLKLARKYLAREDLVTVVAGPAGLGSRF